MTKNMRITVGDESYLLKSAIISGKMDNIFDSPVSMYGGPIDLDELHTALYYTNRTVIKLLVDEFGIPLEKTDDFLVSAMSEALVKEYNNSTSGDSDMDYKRRIRYKKDSQK